MRKLKQFVSTFSLIAVLGGIAFMASATVDELQLSNTHVPKHREKRYSIKFNKADGANRVNEGWMQTLVKIDDPEAQDVKLRGYWLDLDEQAQTVEWEWDMGSRTVSGLNDTNNPYYDDTAMVWARTKSVPIASDEFDMEVRMFTNDANEFPLEESAPVAEVLPTADSLTDVATYCISRGDNMITEKDDGQGWDIEAYFKAEAKQNSAAFKVITERHNGQTWEEFWEEETFISQRSVTQDVHWDIVPETENVVHYIRHRLEDGSGNDIETVGVTVGCNWQCADGIDNDMDGNIDAQDEHCVGSTAWDSETRKPECSDGIDNDNGGKIDYSETPGEGDPQCSSTLDDFESEPAGDDIPSGGEE